MGPGPPWQSANLHQKIDKERPGEGIQYSQSESFTWQHQPVDGDTQVNRVYFNFCFLIVPVLLFIGSFVISLNIISFNIHLGANL